MSSAVKNNELERSLLDCPTTSYWLKDQLITTKTRDPVDVLNDLELLSLVLAARAGLPASF